MATRTDKEVEEAFRQFRDSIVDNRKGVDHLHDMLVQLQVNVESSKAIREYLAHETHSKCDIILPHESQFEKIQQDMESAREKIEELQDRLHRMSLPEKHLRRVPVPDEQVPEVQQQVFITAESQQNGVHPEEPLPDYDENMPKEGSPTDHVDYTTEIGAVAGNENTTSKADAATSYESNTLKEVAVTSYENNTLKEDAASRREVNTVETLEPLTKTETQAVVATIEAIKTEGRISEQEKMLIQNLTLEESQNKNKTGKKSLMKNKSKQDKLAILREDLAANRGDTRLTPEDLTLLQHQLLSGGFQTRTLKQIRQGNTRIRASMFEQF